MNGSLPRRRVAHRLMSAALLVMPMRGIWAQGRAPMTLADVLREARVANAHLPVAALGAALAREQVREARGRVGPRLIFDGDVHQGAPLTYSSGDARFQVIGADTLYDGGRLKANLRATEYFARAAEAGYRVAQKDVDLEVRLRFAEGLDAERAIEIHTTGLDRLRAYLVLVEAQRAGGLGVASDVLRTRTRVAAEAASLADSERALDEAQLELNTLMGRAPEDSLALAPLPPPTAPATPPGQPWLLVPDIVAAEALTAQAQAAIAVARADRQPQVSVTADAGALPTLSGPVGGGLNTGSGLGTEITLWFTWPLLDRGVAKSRQTQAELAARQAADSARVVRQQSHLEWSRAVAQLEDLYRIVQLRGASVTIARDSYLESESLYRGSVGTALDVLDAYSSWIDAQIAEADATMNYRQAEARLIRWGTP